MRPMELLRNTQSFTNSAALQRQLALLLCDVYQTPEFSSLRRTVIYGVGQDARRREVEEEVCLEHGPALPCLSRSRHHLVRIIPTTPGCADIARDQRPTGFV